MDNERYISLSILNVLFFPKKGCKIPKMDFGE